MAVAAVEKLTIVGLVLGSPLRRQRLPVAVPEPETCALMLGQAHRLAEEAK